VPKVRKPQVRHRQSDLLQQVEVVAAVSGERVLDGANMGTVVPDHVASAERAERHDAGNQATATGADEGAGSAVHGDTARRAHLPVGNIDADDMLVSSLSLAGVR